MPGMGLTLSPDPTPVLILAVSSAFITTIVSTTDYTLNNNIQVVQRKISRPSKTLDYSEVKLITESTASKRKLHSSST